MSMKTVMATKCLDLIESHKSENHRVLANKLTFKGVEGYDVYNISHRFILNGENYIAGRVEKRENETSHVRFFKQESNYTYGAVYPEIEFTNFQDPFVATINGELILGGVQVDFDPLNKNRIICWRTLFYRGKDVESLSLFARGPNNMKDIRLGQLPNNRIAIFTRPQGGNAGFGKIGYTSVDSLENINEKEILSAKIYDTHFISEEWGGANHIIPLEDGDLGVVGHISYRDDHNKLHYHSMVFEFNPNTLEHTPVRIIATRSEIGEGPAKRRDLTDVLFTGGLIKDQDGRFLLYTGVSDCEAYELEIDNPF